MGVGGNDFRCSGFGGRALDLRTWVVKIWSINSACPGENDQPVFAVDVGEAEAETVPVEVCLVDAEITVST